MAASGNNSVGSKQYWPAASIPPSLYRKDRQALVYAGFDYNNSKTNNFYKNRTSPKYHNQNQNNNNAKSSNGNVNLIQSMRFPLDFDMRFTRGGTQQNLTDNNNNSSKHQYSNVSSRSNDPWKMMKNNQNNIHNKSSWQLDKANIFAVLKKRTSCPLVEVSPTTQQFKEEDRNRSKALNSGVRGLSVVSSPAPLQVREDPSTTAGSGGNGNDKCLTANNLTRESGKTEESGGTVITTQSQSTESRG